MSAVPFRGKALDFVNSVVAKMASKDRENIKKGEDEFNLQDVLDFGGTEDDFEMLKNLEQSSGAKNLEKDTLQDDEFKQFFDSLGFKNIKHDQEESDDGEDVLDEEEDTVPQNPTSKQINRKNPKSKTEVRNASPLQDDEISSTTVIETSNKQTKATSSDKDFSKILELAAMLPNKTICKITTPWYENNIFTMSAKQHQLEVSGTIKTRLKSLGEKLLKNEGDLYKDKKSKHDSRDEAWLKTVVTSGTLSDRVAGYTLMLQNAPLHNYWCLEAFIHMLKKKGKREAIIGLDALKEVFLSELLPDSRKLRFFEQQPLGFLIEILKQESGGATSKRTEFQRYIIQWMYEDHIKTSYRQLVFSLRDFFLQDSMEAIKTKGMKAALELLTTKPEQEKELLTMLVNKLGDPKYKIASKSLHMLNCLIRDHPVMQEVVVHAVRDLLLRPNVLPKCQYYCICFLGAQILSHDRKEVADLLIQVYLGFFKAAVKKTQVDDKLLSAILTGVNRAYPYASTDDMKITEELNVLFRTIHISGFGTSVQALMLLFQILSSRNELSDRYYNALYGALLHPELPICTNRHPMFLNLLFRSLKADSSQSRVQAFLKRLLQTCSLQHASYTSAVLILIMEILKARPGLSCFFDSSRFSSTTKNATTGTSDEVFDNDSDEEHFVDVDEMENKTEEVPKKDSDKGSSWTHLHKKSLHRNIMTYDPVHRNPTFSNAERAPLWELQRIMCHFHPTVSQFAVNVGATANQGRGGAPDRYPGDPLQDFTLIRFLDKFVYRNPKAKHEKEVNANAGDAPFRRKRKITFADKNSVPANTPEFLAKKKFNPEEIFLQKYFASRVVPTKKEKSVPVQEEDVESVSDDEFDRFLSTSEGQAELDRQYNFADGAMGPNNKKSKVDLIQESDEEELSEEEFDLDDTKEASDEENPFDEDGMFFDEDDENDKEEVPSKGSKKSKKMNKKKSSADVDAFDMMLEENTQNRFNAGGSGAVQNKDRSSLKQLQWERKKELKDIISKKRSAKQNDKFSNKKKRSGFGGNKGERKFLGKKKFGKTHRR